MVYLFAQFGIESARLRLERVSAAEADKCAQVVNEMTQNIKVLGPLKFL
jgi:coenzyme F420-reducing hydrogenase delta subunit